MTTTDNVRIDPTALRQARRKQFLTRPELAERAGLNPTHVYRLERGVGQEASRLDTIRKLAEALGVPPIQLIDE